MNIVGSWNLVDKGEITISGVIEGDNVAAIKKSAGMVKAEATPAKARIALGRLECIVCMLEAGCIEEDPKVW